MFSQLVGISGFNPVRGKSSDRKKSKNEQQEREKEAQYSQQQDTELAHLPKSSTDM